MIREHNRKAWDQQVDDGSIWTIPVDKKQVTEARMGNIRIFLMTEIMNSEYHWNSAITGTTRSVDKLPVVL